MHFNLHYPYPYDYLERGLAIRSLRVNNGKAFTSHDLFSEKRIGSGNKKKWKFSNIIFMVACVISFCENSLISALAPFFPEYAKISCGASTLLVGAILAAFPLTNMIASPICGIISSRLGQIKVLKVGLILLILSTFSFGLASKAFLFFGARCLQGVASACVNVGMLSLLLDVSDDTTSSIAAIEVFTGLGYIMGPPIGALLFSMGGFRFTFMVLASLPLAVFLVLLLALKDVHNNGTKDTIENDSSSPHSRGISMSSNPSLIILVLTNVIAMLSVGFIDPIIAKHFKLILGSSVTVVGLLYGLPSLIYSVASVITPRIILALGSRVTLASGFLLLGISYVMLGPAPLLSMLFVGRTETWINSLLCLIVYGFGMALTLVPILPAMQTCMGRENKCNDFTTSLYASSCSAGEFLGPLLGSFLAQQLPKSEEITCFENSCLNGFPWASTIFGLFNILCSFLLYCSFLEMDHFENLKQTVEVAELQEPLVPENSRIQADETFTQQKERL